jgi:hypothetical protein
MRRSASLAVRLAVPVFELDRAAEARDEPTALAVRVEILRVCADTIGPLRDELMTIADAAVAAGSVAVGLALAEQGMLICSAVSRLASASTADLIAVDAIHLRSGLQVLARMIDDYLIGSATCPTASPVRHRRTWMSSARAAGGTVFRTGGIAQPSNERVS